MASGNHGDNLAVSDREAQQLRNDVGDGNFDDKFQEAVRLTKDVSVSHIDWQDKDLLNKMLHERTALLQTSCKFHFVKFADLFDVPRLEANAIDNAWGVLEYLAATREVEPTVAEVLQKLKDTQRCYDLVRKLVDNIIKRG